MLHFRKGDYLLLLTLLTIKKGIILATTYFRPEGLSSALGYFTSEFGMGSGGATPVLSPK